ncbi:MAG: asparagine synthase (glutamine-hydrolyzing) [Ferruginibacter sp.]
MRVPAASRDFFWIFTTMCGIAGIISSDTNAVSRESLKKMTDAIAHRGPDGEAQWVSHRGNVGLGHRRLSILDLSPAAAQPMHYLNRYTIVYNGEIYNYIEIKEELQKMGYRFQNKSDTEVILAAYDCWKEDCLEQFDGMFAFAILDKKERTLFAARDRFGEKPFYYTATNNMFAFASEMKSLWAIGIGKNTDDKMLLNYLALGYVQNANDKEQTFFQDIYSLAPGSFLKLNVNTLQYRTHIYWELDKDNAQPISANEAIEKFRELFSLSVRHRLRSDVPVGTSLSGGLDSSSILAMINHPGQQFHTFSAIFPGFAKDESVYIKAVTEHLSKSTANGPLKQHFIEPSALGLIKDFKTLCYHQEEPFPSSSIYAQYKVFEMAHQQQVKVLLDGQGADEILAGYNKYIHWYLQQLAGKSRFLAAYRERKMLLKNKLPFRWGISNYLAAYLPSHASIQLEQNEYLKSVRQPDINKDFVLGLQGREWEGIRKPIITKLNDILYFNTQTMGLEELLRFADRNSMAHSTEVRLPFLHHELVQFIFTLPAGFKIHDGWTKWLLRKTMDKKLPDEVVWRKEKVGYEPPQFQWMHNEILQDYIQEAKRKLVNKGVLKAASLNKKITPKAAHESNNFDWRYLCAAQMIAGDL